MKEIKTSIMIFSFFPHPLPLLLYGRLHDRWRVRLLVIVKDFLISWAVNRLLWPFLRSNCFVPQNSNRLFLMLRDDMKIKCRKNFNWYTSFYLHIVNVTLCPLYPGKRKPMSVANVFPQCGGGRTVMRLGTLCTQLPLSPMDQCG